MDNAPKSGGLKPQTIVVQQDNIYETGSVGYCAEKCDIGMTTSANEAATSSAEFMKFCSSPDSPWSRY